MCMRETKISYLAQYCNHITNYAFITYPDEHIKNIPEKPQTNAVVNRHVLIQIKACFDKYLNISVTWCIP